MTFFRLFSKAVEAGRLFETEISYGLLTWRRRFSRASRATCPMTRERRGSLDASPGAIGLFPITSSKLLGKREPRSKSVVDFSNCETLLAASTCSSYYARHDEIWINTGIHVDHRPRRLLATTRVQAMALPPALQLPPTFIAAILPTQSLQSKSCPRAPRSLTSTNPPHNTAPAATAFHTLRSSLNPPVLKTARFRSSDLPASLDIFDVSTPPSPSSVVPTCLR